MNDSTIHHLGRLEQRAGAASAALLFTTGCGDCPELQQITEALWLAMKDLGEHDPPAVLIARTQPELWEFIEQIEVAVADLESSVYAARAMRVAPGVN